MTESTEGRLPVIRFSDDADGDSFFTVLNHQVYEFVKKDGTRILGIADHLGTQPNSGEDYIAINESLGFNEFHIRYLYINEIAEAIYI